jgi:NADH-quinone oxidoreductase subunit M
MIALIVVMGVMPQPFLAPAKPAVDRLVRRFQAVEVRLGKGPQVGTDTTAIGARALLRLPEPPAAAMPTLPAVPEVH